MKAGKTEVVNNNHNYVNYTYLVDSPQSNKNGLYDPEQYCLLQRLAV